MAYNGWSNRATWNVSLWLNNDEGTYRELVSLQRRAYSKEKLAEYIEQFCRDIWPNGETPDGDKLADADFEEIAESEWDEDDHPPTTYDEAAERFGISLTCNRIDSRPDNLQDWQRDARHFHCRLKCGKRSFGFYFTQGSAHTANPTIADVLGCMMSDAISYDSSASFEEWASDLGFDADSRKAERIYRATKKQTEQLRRTVGDKAFTLLRDCEE